MAAPLPCLFGYAEMEGLHPSKPPRRIGIGYRIPMGEVVVPRPPVLICHLLFVTLFFGRS